MNKISMDKYYRLNESIHTIRDFCIKEFNSSCAGCPFWKETMSLKAMGTKDCMFNDRLPEDWDELPKEVLDKE